MPNPINLLAEILSGSLSVEADLAFRSCFYCVVTGELVMI